MTSLPRQPDGEAMSGPTGDPRADPQLTHRATFRPFLRSSPIAPVGIPADPAAARLVALKHLERYGLHRGPLDVTILRGLSGGAVWVGGHVADIGWHIDITEDTP